MSIEDPRVKIEQEPIINLYHPDWWNGRGRRMALLAFGPLESNPSLVVIGATAAELVIAKVDDQKYDQPLWSIRWNLRHSRHESVQGNIVIPKDILLGAFGLEDTTTTYSRWLIERYGGSSAEVGSYIRWRRFLNIPGPGTGHNGDPNVSIELDDKMRDAVGNLVGLSSDELSIRKHNISLDYE